MERGCGPLSPVPWTHAARVAPQACRLAGWDQLAVASASQSLSVPWLELRQPFHHEVFRQLADDPQLLVPSARSHRPHKLEELLSERIAKPAVGEARELVDRRCCLRLRRLGVHRLLPAGAHPRFSRFPCRRETSRQRWGHVIKWDISKTAGADLVSGAASVRMGKLT